MRSQRKKLKLTIQLDEHMKPELRLSRGGKNLVVPNDELAMLRNQLLDLQVWEKDQRKPGINVEDLNLLLAPMIARADGMNSPILSDLLTLKLEVNRAAKC
jgi:hypothetical protein